MKNLFVCLGFPPPLEGGSHVHIYNLATNLPSQEVVVYSNSKPDHKEHDARLPFPVVRSSTFWLRSPRPTRWGKLRMVIEWLRTVPTLVRRERVDIIQAGDLQFAGSVSRVLHRRLATPYIVYSYAEELSFAARLGGYRGVYARAAVKSVVRHAAGIVVVSDFTIDLLERFGADRRKTCKIIPPAYPAPLVDPDRCAQVAAKYGIDPGANIILCLARLTNRKGQDRLVQSFPAILERVPDAQLVIAGRGPRLEHVQALANDLRLGKRIVIAGFVPTEEVPALYDLCTVFAMPQRELPDGDTEGCPTVFLEAGAHGKPVVGGKAGGVRDAILEGETGLIVDGDQPQEIAQAITRLLIDRDLAARLGERGRRRVVEELTPRQAGTRLREFTAKVLGRSRSPA
jgi:phosphatidylinositol alpha-1,6-mannosyltransferase